MRRESGWDGWLVPTSSVAHRTSLIGKMEKSHLPDEKPSASKSITMHLIIWSFNKKSVRTIQNLESHLAPKSCVSLKTRDSLKSGFRTPSASHGVHLPQPGSWSPRKWSNRFARHLRSLEIWENAIWFGCNQFVPNAKKIHFGQKLWHSGSPCINSLDFNRIHLRDQVQLWFSICLKHIFDDPLAAAKVHAGLGAQKFHRCHHLHWGCAPAPVKKWCQRAPFLQGVVIDS